MIAWPKRGVEAIERLRVSSNKNIFIYLWSPDHHIVYILAVAIWLKCVRILYQDLHIGLNSNFGLGAQVHSKIFCYAHC